MTNTVERAPARGVLVQTEWEHLVGVLCVQELQNVLCPGLSKFDDRSAGSAGPSWRPTAARSTSTRRRLGVSGAVRQSRPLPTGSPLAPLSSRGDVELHWSGEDGRGV
jgi:hypothetical protein